MNTKIANARMVEHDGEPVSEPVELRVSRPVDGSVDVSVTGEGGITVRLFENEWARVTEKDAQAMTEAVLDVLAPWADAPPELGGPVRVPAIRIEITKGQVVVPDEETMRAIAEQVVTRIRAAAHTCPHEACWHNHPELPERGTR